MRKTGMPLKLERRLSLNTRTALNFIKLQYSIHVMPDARVGKSGWLEIMQHQDKKILGIIKVSISIPSDTLCQITIVAQEHHDLLGIAHRTSYWTYALSIVPNGFFDLLLVLIASKILLRSIVLTVNFPINFAIHFICWSMKKCTKRDSVYNSFEFWKKI